jgi:SPP1 gp7 family putative phage head morphogenesis protein
MPDIPTDILPELQFLFNLAPEKAIAYLEAKGFKFSWDWQDTWEAAHNKAFTVAKVMKLDILQDIRDEVTKSLTDGITFDQFKRELEPLLKEQGWWGKVPASEVPGYDTASGVDPDKIVQLGSPRRLETIYRTNIRTSMSAGHYKTQIEEADDRPYWMWVQVDRPNKRPYHAKLNGMVLRFDDPFWDTNYPPNGFGCECRVRALSKSEVTELGLKIASGDIIDMQPEPGWAYNPGKENFTPDLSKFDSSLVKQYNKTAQ